jgi:ParB-like nuclease family protein
VSAPYQVCEPLTPEEYEALKASIEEHGVRVPIEVDDEGNILDGHNRAEIAQLLQIPCPTTVKAGLKTPEEKRAYARTINCARRQMTPEKKQKILRDQIIETPELSNNWLAEIVGVACHTVISTREDLESGLHIAKLDKLRGKDGKLYAAEKTKPPRFPWLYGIGWQPWHRQEAMHYLHQMTEDEKDTLSAMILSAPVSPPEAVKLLGGMIRLPQPKRERVLELWASEDERDRGRAISLAAGTQPMPDPRIALLEGAVDYLQRAMRASPVGEDVEELKERIAEVRLDIRRIREREDERYGEARPASAA